jgi:hypothetical protein
VARVKASSRTAASLKSQEVKLPFCYAFYEIVKSCQRSNRKHGSARFVKGINLKTEYPVKRSP